LECVRFIRFIGAFPSSAGRPLIHSPEATEIGLRISMNPPLTPPRRAAGRTRTVGFSPSEGLNQRSGKHPTTNIQHPTPNWALPRTLFDVRRWMLDIGCSAFDWSTQPLATNTMRGTGHARMRDDLWSRCAQGNMARISMNPALAPPRRGTGRARPLMLPSLEFGAVRRSLC